MAICSTGPPASLPMNSRSCLAKPSESLREAITIAAQSDFIAKELPVPLMNKYFEYQTQLCHGYESAPDPQAWERENCFLKI